MSSPVAEDVMQKAQAFGLRLAVSSSGNLKWTSSQLPPQELLDSLKACKPDILKLLTLPKPKAWVMRVCIDGRHITAIDTTAPDLQSAMDKQRERWGRRLTEISPKCSMERSYNPPT